MPADRHLNVAWMTPLARRSAIGRYSIAAVGALSALADVDVFYPATGDDLTCAGARSHTPIDRIGPLEERLGEYDAIFYNFGNYLDYHTQIFDCYLRVPGVAIMHDKVMQGFLVSRITRQDPPYYLQLMDYVYGAPGRRIARDVLRSGWTTEIESLTAREFPLFEPCLFNAYGAVVHSRGALDLIARRYGDLLPVTAIDLPTFVYDMEYAGQSLMSREELDLAPDATLVVVAGRMNPTKRLDVILAAVGDDPELRAAIQLVFVGGGDAEYLKIARELADRSCLGERLRLVFDPDDREMHSYIAAADVCVNLRNPSTETASASLVEQLYFGKPVIVTRTGVYDEVPDDVVLKTDVSGEVESVREALRRLVFDVALRARLAESASRYVQGHHSPDVYARRIVEFVESLDTRTRELRAADAAAEELRGLPIDGGFEDRVARLALCVTGQLWKTRRSGGSG